MTKEELAKEAEEYALVDLPFLLEEQEEQEEREYYCKDCRDLLCPYSGTERKEINCSGVEED